MRRAFIRLLKENIAGAPTLRDPVYECGRFIDEPQTPKGQD